MAYASCSDGAGITSALRASAASSASAAARCRSCHETSAATSTEASAATSVATSAALPALAHDRPRERRARLHGLRDLQPPLLYDPDRPPLRLDLDAPLAAAHLQRHPRLD